jgi:hypothetical protein
MSMSMRRQGTRLAVALLLVVAAAGCAGPADEGQEDVAAQAGTAAGADPGSAGTRHVR